MLFSPYTRKTLFRIFAFLGCCAALYHLTGVFYDIDATPLWRHLLFVAVNLFCVYGILRRPAYFTWLFGALLVQQYYSHGRYLIKLWSEQHRVHWLSVAVLTLLPLVLLCLVDDYKARKQA
jgi:hypothetical protein